MPAGGSVGGDVPEDQQDAKTSNSLDADSSDENGFVGDGVTGEYPKLLDQSGINELDRNNNELDEQTGRLLWRVIPSALSSSPAHSRHPERSEGSLSLRQFDCLAGDSDPSSLRSSG